MNKTLIISSVFILGIALSLLNFSFIGVNIPLSLAQNHSTDSAVTSSRGINNDKNRVSVRDSREIRNIVGKHEFRTIDGSGNNLNNTDIAATFINLLRLVNSDYSDGISELAGDLRLSPREISNVVNDQDELIPNHFNTTDYLWQWGQFVDHDIDLTDAAVPAEEANINVPTGDPYFDPNNTGGQLIFFNRSLYDSETGTDTSNPREQLNEITAWIDASNVYGSDEERANALRTFDGDGKLKTSDGNLLPFNELGLPNAGGTSTSLFLAGDVRANEQVGLTAMHTLFVREHNRLTDLIAQRNPNLSGEEIYQKARRLVGAEMQIITYREYLPALLGRNMISSYKGYKPSVNASIANSFSAASYRYGHSALSPTLLRLDVTGAEIADGNLALRDAFFNPTRITDEGGIEPLLRGLASQKHQKIDIYIIDDIRNFLFGEPGQGGFDLASLNIQRGRDHGLPSYNDMREAVGLGRVNSFSDINSDPEIQSRLEEVYDSVDNIDIWIGGLSEKPLNNSHLGELFSTLLVIQFESLRDGDRFWFERTLSKRDLDMIQNTRLSDIIIRNTNIKRGEIQKDVFRIKNR